MATFHEFVDNGTDLPISINADHVSQIGPDSDDPEITVIRFVDGSDLGVRGKYVDVLRKLSANTNPTRTDRAERSH